MQAFGFAMVLRLFWCARVVGVTLDFLGFLDLREFGVMLRGTAIGWDYVLGFPFWVLYLRIFVIFGFGFCAVCGTFWVLP